MNFREANINEFELLNSLWWMWCNDHLSKGVINYILEDLAIEIEFITLDGYKFISKDKKTTYSYDRKQ